jgi:arylsulfatase A-like enzyme
VDYSPDFIESRAIDFIKDCKDDPFFLYYCPTLPHANNEGGDTPDGMEVDTYGEFDECDWLPNEKGFARMVQRIDITVGKILDTLKELGIADNTLVIFTSDNGPHDEGGHSVTRFDSSGGFQGYKRSLHEGGIRIPFIAWWPGTIESSVSNHMGYFPDLLPTFNDIANLDYDGPHDGISIFSLLTGNKSNQQKQHEYLYFEYRDQFAVRKGKWKYYVNDEGEEFLFDLENDRHEDRNIKDNEPGVFSDLKLCAEREHKDYIPVQSPVYYEAGYHRRLS